MKREDFGFPGWKRAMDILLSSIGLILFTPLFVGIAVLIKLTSPGPVMFRQERIGRHRKPFLLWKFRTMRAGAKPAAHQKHLSELIASDSPMVKLDAAGDSRVFPLGRILRRTCMDELPQLINVFLGDMSLVGPRPCMPYEAPHFRDWQLRRFDAMPGITGLWQVSGKNRTTFTEMVKLDIAYLDEVSFTLDLKILCKTIPAIISDGLYSGAARGAANAH